ncbi:hypothetical protein C8J56DRAFT_1022507 [Mycena floridula]|nr:hypothetical protein C8J56DRAFT_1022507 [Mycena floridula]
MQCLHSPFQSVLGSNYAPDEAELGHIRALTLAPLLEIEKLNLEIQRLQKARDELQSFAEAHQALLSPIRRISPELLQQIFIACLPTAHNAVMHKSQAPMLLTQVSSGWRRIALGTVELWSSIHSVVPQDLKSAQFNMNLRNAIRDWIDRSGVLPLDFTLLTELAEMKLPIIHHLPDDNFHTPETKDFSSFLQLFLQHSNRWRHVELSMFSDLDAAASLETIRGSDVPLLETLAFKALGNYGVHQLRLPEDIANHFSFLLDAPRLNTIKLVGDWFFWLPPAPRAQLVELELDYRRVGAWSQESTVAAAVDFLAECLALEILTLKFAPTNSPQDTISGMTHLRLEHLRSLCLHMHCWLRVDEEPTERPVAMILDAMTLPSLEDLDILFNWQLSPFESLEQLLNRSPTASLRNLSLRSSTVPLAPLLPVLRLSPKLTAFYLGRTVIWNDPAPTNYVADPLWSMMMNEPDSLCPGLESITLHNCFQLGRAFGGPLMDFLHSRTCRENGVKPVQKVCILFPSIPDENLPVAEFDWLKETGIEVVLESRGFMGPLQPRLPAVHGIEFDPSHNAWSAPLHDE